MAWSVFIILVFRRVLYLSAIELFLPHLGLHDHSWTCYFYAAGDVTLHVSYCGLVAGEHGVMNEIIPVTICTMATERSDYALTGVVLVVVLLVTTLTTNAVESRSVQIYGVSSVAWCALIALGIQWLAWIPASLLQTERFYDLLGGVTYLALVVFSLWAGSQNHGVSTREVVISFCLLYTSPSPRD